MRVGIISMIISGILAVSSYGAYSASEENTKPVNESELQEHSESSIETVVQKAAEDSVTGVFLTVEGISLYDDQKAVIEKLGKPLATQEDPYFKESEIYEYQHITIGFMDGIVEYVDVSSEAGSVYVNKTKIPLQESELLDRLGNPDFTEEDGLVFVRGETIIKLFRDSNSNKLLSLCYYHMASV